MREIERILDQLQRAYSGSAWHGPSLQEVLADVSAEQALARPIEGAHCIWEIVLHLLSAGHIICRRLDGERAEATPKEDWPAVKEDGDLAWQKALDALDRSHRETVSRIKRLTVKDLDQPIVDGFSSIYVTLHGHVQHILYHAGQIAILKKGRSMTVLY